MSNHRLTIGIDNGSTGSIGILGSGAMETAFVEVPTRDSLHYGKRGTVSKRLDRQALIDLIQLNQDWRQARVFIERPFTGKFINAVLPAHRFFEATIITLEDLKLGYEVIDSREWQAEILGDVHGGSAALKRASKLRGIQYYPALTLGIQQQGDADGLLIAHYYHNRA